MLSYPLNSNDEVDDDSSEPSGMLGAENTITQGKTHTLNTILSKTAHQTTK